jgi:hypothetical protein
MTLEKFLKKVKIAENGCWEWQGALTATGYGKSYLSQNERQAHRIGWFLHGNNIDKGLQLDHLCRNRKCVNPKHLEPVTQRVNFERGMAPAAINLRKTHCKRGHEFDVFNTRYLNKGQRQCKECVRISQRKENICL